MTPSRRPPRESFIDLLAGLSPRSFERLVGDLYSAQGWTASRDGAVIRLRREEPVPARRSVLAISGSRDTTAVRSPDVDLVVAARHTSTVERFADELGADLRGPGDLYELAMFGVARESTAAIFRAHFDRDLVAEWDAEKAISTSSTATRGTEEGTTPRDDTGTGAAGGIGGPERDSPPRFRRSAVAAGIVLFVVLVVVAGAGGGLDPQWALGVDRSTGSPGQVTSERPGESTPGVGATTSSTPGDTTGSVGTEVTGYDRPALGAQPRYVGLTPTCERPPGLVTVIIVGALRNNDPATDDGIRTAWNFSSRASVGSRYESFARNVKRAAYEPLSTHRSAEYAPVYREPGIASHRVTVTGRDGDQRSFLVVLANQTVGPRAGCWLLAGIVAE